MNTHKATVIITGAAGFVGSHVAHALLTRGFRVVGIDNLNDYYLPRLKTMRLDRLREHNGFIFHKIDIADHDRMRALNDFREADVVIHLAAQAGVRYSLENPFAYASSNLLGHLSVLECVRHAPQRPRLVYASSSSVYGANTKAPFCESDPVTKPVSLYAATKRADELLSESYARLYDIEQIGLRFFTVYGPWGRPDMAYWTFTEKVLAGEPIQVFNNGDMERDFTYIDDIVAGVIATALEPAQFESEIRHRVYNIGNNKPEKLLRFIEIIEAATGREAIKKMEPMQPGDVYATFADIDAIKKDYGFTPTTSLEDGMQTFVDWYREFRDAMNS